MKTLPDILLHLSIIGLALGFYWTLEPIDGSPTFWYGLTVFTLSLITFLISFCIVQTQQQDELDAEANSRE